MAVRIATMTIRIMADEDRSDDENQRVVDDLDWGDVADNINETLPEGYYCKIEDHSYGTD